MGTRRRKTSVAEPPQQANDGTSNKELLVNEKSNVRMQSFYTRTIWTLAMLFGFAGVIAGGQLPLCLMVMAMQCVMFSEIVSLVRSRNEARDLPGFRFWYFFTLFVTVFFAAGRLLHEPLAQAAASIGISFVTRYHTFISFSLAVVAFVAFVFSLKKGHYGYQVKMFGWVMLADLLVVAQSTTIMANVFQGMIWTVLPSLLIVSNDVFSYIVGFFFGRTRLIKLSPKKTWEGFVGGAVCTSICTVLLASLLQRFEFWVCPKTDGFPLRWTTCDVNPMFVPSISLPLGLQVSEFQLHALVIGLFASIVAPFGGFFASGIKRAIGAKDFGTSIPGHGGLTDRMDCQILMGCFVYVYFNAFVRRVASSVPTVVAAFLALSPEQQAQAFRQIDEYAALQGLV